MLTTEEMTDGIYKTMKLENNWRHKSLENLDKNIRTALSLDESSRLIKTCDSLRKKPLQDFTTEDLRVMIGQEIGLSFLIPLAIEIFQNDLFAEGDMYEGDLLKNVLEVKTKFWDENKEYWRELNNIIKDRRNEIAKIGVNISKFDNCKHK